MENREGSKSVGMDFIVTSVIIPLLGVGSIICSIKYKNMMRKRGTIITDFYNCSCCSFGVQHH